MCKVTLGTNQGVLGDREGPRMVAVGKRAIHVWKGESTG